MARTFAALLVDSDLKGLEALVYGFQGAAWRSTACPTPDAASFLVKASAAEVVVVASREPHDKTLALVRQLRSQDDTRNVPLLVLGPAHLRASVLESGNVDFLSTPVFVRDVIASCRIAMALAGDSEPRIEGSLAELSLLSLLRSLSGLGRSGVLRVERANRGGEVLFSDGELTGAQLGALQGSAALHHLLMWEDGKISLQLRPVGRRAPVNQRCDQVIEDAERFLRDYSHAISSLGSSSTIYDRNEGKSAQSFPSEVMPIVRLCDGKRTLADLIDQSPFRVFDTIRIVSRLVDLGAITRRPVADVRSQPARELQTFWDTARIASPDDDSARPPVVASSARDARVGEPNRRKLQRRARAETPVLGTPLTDLVDARPPAAQSAAAAPPPGETKGKERTSGVLQVPSGERRQARVDRRERPSVTIDVGLVEAAMAPPTPPPVAVSTPVNGAKPRVTPAAGSPVVRPTGKPRVTPAAGSPVVRPMGSPAMTPVAGAPVLNVAGRPAVTPATGMASPSDQSSRGAVGGAASAPVAPVVAESSAPRQGRITGTLVSQSSANRKSGPVPVVGASVSVDPALVKPTSDEKAAAPVSSADEPAKPEKSGSATGAQGEAARGARITGTLSISPSQRIVRPQAPSSGVSVQLDPVLMAELDRLEKSTTPVGREDPALDAPTAPLKPGGRRITGTLSVASSSAASHKKDKRADSGVSVALDPGLVEEAQRSTTGPAADVAKPGHAPTAGAPDSEVKRPSQPMAAAGEGSRAGSRISGAFNAIESDFFAREADLYRRESEDNFTDLDEPAGGRAGSKPAPRRTNRR